MNDRVEAKLTDLSGFHKAVNGILLQAWERGRKYQEKLYEEQAPNVIYALQTTIAMTHL